MCSSDLDGDEAKLRTALREYGNAIKELAGAGIFPGDMLLKNFGVTRHDRVVFYDYDEIAYMIDCNFRRIPPPRSIEDEMSAEAWYRVDKRDMFPEHWGPFLLGDDRIRAAFLKHHADLLTPEFWSTRRQRILAGHLEDVFPYPQERRFRRRFASEFDPS